jgi:hypothetical protein
MKLEDFLGKLNINAVFLGGVRDWDSKIGTGDYYGATDFVTFMSDTEGWGLPPLEAAITRKPCITRRYTDFRGNPIFDEHYNGFEFLLSESEADSVDTKILYRVLDIIHDPKSYRSILENNLIKAKRYNIIIGIKKLLEAMDINIDQ